MELWIKCMKCLALYTVHAWWQIIKGVNVYCDIIITPNQILCQQLTWSNYCIKYLDVTFKPIIKYYLVIYLDTYSYSQFLYGSQIVHQPFV